LAVAAIPLFIYYQSPFLVAYKSLSAGQVPAVGLQFGRFIGTLNVGAIATLASTTDTPVDGSVDHYHWAWSLGVVVALTITLPSWMGHSSSALSQDSIPDGRVGSYALIYSLDLPVFSNSVVV
jgi:hypothetical protein